MIYYDHSYTLNKRLMTISMLNSSNSMIQPLPTPHGESASLTQIVDARRRKAMSKLDAEDKAAQGQFMTPHRVAGFMASLFSAQVGGDVRLLDAGAGVGSLTAAFVEEFLNRKLAIDRIAVTAYEIDSLLAEELRRTLGECQRMCAGRHGV